MDPDSHWLELKQNTIRWEGKKKRFETTRGDPRLREKRTQGDGKGVSEPYGNINLGMKI